MPLTPRFDIDQTETHVIVTIHVPTIRISNDNIEILLLEGYSQLHFYAKPYLLKLDFAPRQFQDPDVVANTNDDDDDDGCCVASAKYDPSGQTVTIPLLKKKRRNVVVGAIDVDDGMSSNNSSSSYWPNLDLTARLIRPKEIPRQWLHSVVDNSHNNNGNNNNNGDDENENENGEVDIGVSPDTASDGLSRRPRMNDDGGVVDDDDDDENADVVNVDRRLHPPPSAATMTHYGYGFANMFRNIFSDYCRSGLASEVLQLGVQDPGLTSPIERRKQRLAKEENDFDIDHYYQDLDLCAENNDDDYMYPAVITFVPWWEQRHNNTNNNNNNNDDGGNSSGSQQQDDAAAAAVIVLLANKLESNMVLSPATAATAAAPAASSDSHPTTTTLQSLFSRDERLLLSTIPYPLLPKSTMVSLLSGGGGSTGTPTTSTQQQQQQQQPDGGGTGRIGLWCGLLDVLLAYTYDHLFTLGDPSVESAWTVAMLSPNLSWLDGTANGTVQDTVTAFLRRAVIYPYWRSLDFGVDVVAKETLSLLKKKGVPGITKALLQVRQIFDKSEYHYIHNKIWIDPYLYWIQHQEEGDSIFAQCIADLERVLQDDHRHALKDSLGLDLVTHENEYRRQFIDEENNASDDDDDDDDVSSHNASSGEDSGSEIDDDEGADATSTIAATSKTETPIEILELSKLLLDEGSLGATQVIEGHVGQRQPTTDPLSLFFFGDNDSNDNRNHIQNVTCTIPTINESSKTGSRKLIVELSEQDR